MAGWRAKFQERVKTAAQFAARVARRVRLALTTQESLVMQMEKAIAKDDGEKLKTLIAQGAPVNGRGYGNTPPLACALGEKHYDMAKILLAAGASPNVETDYAMSTLFIDTVRAGDATGVAVLLAAKVKPDVRKTGSRRDAPLALAVAGGFDEIAQQLLDAGAPVDARNRYGQTALFYAAWRGRDGLAQKLLKAGARTEYEDSDGQDALSAAKAAGNLATADIIQRAIDARVPAWQTQGEDAVAHVSILRDAGYKLTEIFNFTTERYAAVTHNYATGRDETVIRTFAELGEDKALAEARRRHAARTTPQEKTP